MKIQFFIITVRFLVPVNKLTPDIFLKALASEIYHFILKLFLMFVIR